MRAVRQLFGVPLLLAFRLLTNPLIEHFGDCGGDTHGSARFATKAEISPLVRALSGLLIGRNQESGRLLRYDGPTHLLTMTPTHSGKGVSTLIPNLLTADRTVICIDPKAPSPAKVSRRATPYWKRGGPGSQPFVDHGMRMAEVTGNKRCAVSIFR